METQRLDLFLVENGYFETREKSRFAILKGAVLVNKKLIQKPGTFIKSHHSISIIEDEVNPFISIAGLKLKKAIVAFNLDFNQKFVLDIGDSSCGFADCALQNGAKGVISIDNKNVSIDSPLLINSKLANINNIEFKELKLEDINSQILDFIVVDLNLISLTTLMNQFASLMDINTQLVVLIKPQFEAGKEQLGNDGIVKNPKTHEKIIKVVEKSANMNGLAFTKLTYSPIFEVKKNIEYLALISKRPQIQSIFALNIIKEAFEFQKNLKKNDLV
ncbi:MAG: SAM-dependent methyltransferase [Bacteroidota bacterium]